MSLAKLVAIVDDEQDITQLFQDALSSKIDDISVVSFNDPILALEHYKQHKKNYALIISDMRMPTMSGLELLKQAKELNPKLRTMLMTAFDLQGNHDLQKYCKKGIIDSFFEKPITINRLCQKVKEEIQTEHQGPNTEP